MHSKGHVAASNPQTQCDAIAAHRPVSTETRPRWQLPSTPATPWISPRPMSMSMPFSRSAVSLAATARPRTDSSEALAHAAVSQTGSNVFQSTPARLHCALLNRCQNHHGMWLWHSASARSHVVIWAPKPVGPNVCATSGWWHSKEQNREEKRSPLTLR